MYTDEDLDTSVEKGIFTSEAVSLFRAHMAGEQHTQAVDEEKFKLVTSFNDIFVVIACLLLLISAGWASQVMLLVSVLAWILAEFFVLKRKMALPAIVLLLAFVSSVYLAAIEFVPSANWTPILVAALSVIAAYLHWWRFRVPLTVAAGTLGLIGFFVATILYLVPSAKDWILAIILVCGVVTFLFAMYWDAADKKRLTHRSDVAFWLHLLSAPLIVHPIFSMLGILDGKESLSSMFVVLLLYVLMTLVSVVIDRRAFMVSSLVYVLYALSELLKVYGVVGYNFALTGVFIGVSLLLLSAFWHTVRAKLLEMLPRVIKQYVPH